MDAAVLRAEMEAEWAWRLDELRFLRNQLSVLSTDDERAIFRKSMVVMLYSHFEGFCKAAFSTYVGALNSEAPALRAVVAALMASSMGTLFHDLRNAEKRSAVFLSTAPDDSGLHRYTRDREFCERFDSLVNGTLAINPESVVDTESNLKPVVLKKILFRLGLDHAAVDPWKGAIGQLLGRRNAIAHGTERAGLDEKAYNTLETTVFEVVEQVTILLFEAAVHSRYLRGAPFAAPIPPVATPPTDGSPSTA